MSLIQSEKRKMEGFEEFEENLRRYTDRRNALKKQYVNQFVAVLKGDVVAHSRTLRGLFDQIPDRDRRKVIVDFLTQNEKLIL